MSNNSQTDDIDTDLAIAAFRMGEAMGLLMKHSKADPKRTTDIYWQILRFFPQGILDDYMIARTKAIFDEK